MIRKHIVLLMALLLAGCSKPKGQLYSSTTDPELAWDQCIFELDKIEALRGRNLDDLNKGLGVARNQFMVDCMTAKNAVLLSKHFDNLSKYAANLKGNDPRDLSLNNGDRK